MLQCPIIKRLLKNPFDFHLVSKNSRAVSNPGALEFFKKVKDSSLV